MAESIYAQIIGEDPEISFRDKVAYCLQNERNHWMQRLYHRGWDQQNSMIFLLGQIVDWQDVHNYNAFLNMYGSEFGLRMAAADNDAIAFVDPFLKYIISLTWGKMIHERFWRDHRISHYMQILNEATGTPELPKPEIYAFWQAWIERQQMDEANKEELKEELFTGNLYGRSIETNEGKISPEFITLMLLDMGIAELA